MTVSATPLQKVVLDKVKIILTILVILLGILVSLLVILLGIEMSYFPCIPRFCIG